MAGRTPSAGHAPPSSGLAGTGLPGTPRRRPGLAGHGTPWHAPLLTRTRAARDSPAPNGPGTTGRHPRGHNGPRSNGPSSAGPRRAAPQRAAIPPGTPRASDQSGQRPSAAFTLGVVEPPNGLGITRSRQAGIAFPKQYRRMHAMTF